MVKNGMQNIFMVSERGLQSTRQDFTPRAEARESRYQRVIDNDPTADAEPRIRKSLASKGSLALKGSGLYPALGDWPQIWRVPSHLVNNNGR